MKKVPIAIAASLIGLSTGFAMYSPSAYAAAKSKVDCDAVMQEVNGGKKAKEVAKDLNISTSSVYKCKKKAKAAAKAGAPAGAEAASPVPEAASPVPAPAAAPKP